MKPEISVIIPNFNHADYIKQRIDSVLNQTYQDFEVIILDDFSTDNSVDIIEQYRNHPKVSKIIFNKINSGNTSKQWEKGINLAVGNFIWIAESDDYCEITLLEELVKNAINCDGCVVSFCQTIMFKDNQILWRTDTKFVNECVIGEDFLRNKMLLGNEICNASMCIFKRDTFNKVDREIYNFKLSGDWIFWVQICLQGKVAISGKYLNYFRKHPKDISSNGYTEGLMYLEYFDVLNYLAGLGLVGNLKQELLILKYKQFINDCRIQAKNISQINQLFKNELGKKYYGLHYKYLFTRILKKSLKAILTK